VDNYPHLSKFIEKYNKAINSNSKDMRLSVIEVGLILQDITELSVSITKTNTNSLALKQSVDMLVEVIKAMIEDNKNDGF
jgi:hypothetical protein